MNKLPDRKVVAPREPQAAVVGESEMASEATSEDLDLSSLKGEIGEAESKRIIGMDRGSKISALVWEASGSFRADKFSLRRVAMAQLLVGDEEQDVRHMVAKMLRVRPKTASVNERAQAAAVELLTDMTKDPVAEVALTAYGSLASHDHHKALKVIAEALNTTSDPVLAAIRRELKAKVIEGMISSPGHSSAPALASAVIGGKGGLLGGGEKIECSFDWSDRVALASALGSNAASWTSGLIAKLGSDEDTEVARHALSATVVGKRNEPEIVDTILESVDRFAEIQPGVSALMMSRMLSQLAARNPGDDRVRKALCTVADFACQPKHPSSEAGGTLKEAISGLCNYGPYESLYVIAQAVEGLRYFVTSDLQAGGTRRGTLGMSGEARMIQMLGEKLDEKTEIWEASLGLAEAIMAFETDLTEGNYPPQRVRLSDSEHGRLRANVIASMDNVYEVCGLPVPYPTRLTLRDRTLRNIDLNRG